MSKRPKVPKPAAGSGGPKGIEKSTRPTREVRKGKRLLLLVDKEYRSRKGKQVKAALDALEAEEPGAIDRITALHKESTPPKKVGSEKVYTGKSRAFEAKFAKDFWDKQPTPWTCAACGGVIAANQKSIDHKVPWAITKLSIPTVDVCINGVHWRCVTTAAMRKVFQDSDNLQPMHVVCNSGKNGPKSSDGIGPQRLGLCPPGVKCSAEKGS
jgi:hypothetical protein